MKTKIFISTVSLISAIFLASIAFADSIDVTFSRVTWDNTEDLSSQLNLTIYDYTSANAVYGGVGEPFSPPNSLTAGQFLFAFSNDIGIRSNITEVYLDDGTPAFSYDSIYNSLGGSTEFFAGYSGVGSDKASPGDLPGGNTLDPVFEANVVLTADVENTSNGVNTADDVLGIVYNSLPSLSIADISNAIESGALRVGLHIRSIGAADGSDSYVTGPAPVPEPATMLLFGTGLAGLIGSRIRGRKN